MFTRIEPAGMSLLCCRRRPREEVGHAVRLAHEQPAGL